MIYFIFYNIIKLIYRSFKYGVEWLLGIFKVISQSAKIYLKSDNRSFKYGVEWLLGIFKVISQSAKI
jgi:hypothetical protein